MRVVTGVGLYRPAWSTPDGKRAPGPDEDMVTMAVAAGQAALGKGSAEHVILVSADPEGMSGPVAAVVLSALRLPMQTPVELRVGGSPAVCDALRSALPGTLVAAVSQTGSPGAAAALVGDDGDMGIRVE